MKPRALKQWFGRLGLAAALLLVVVPTAGRMVQASALAAAGPVAQHALKGATVASSGHDGHGRHDAAASPDARNPDPSAPLPGGDAAADCEYCPLLGSIAAIAYAPYMLALAPVTGATSGGPAAPRLPWQYPSGLGSRGPPSHR